MTPYVVEKNWWVVQTLSIIYPSIIESSGDIKLRVQVEVGCRPFRELFTTESISSLVDEYYSKVVFAQEPVPIPTVSSSITFLEKLFLLVE